MRLQQQSSASLARLQSNTSFRPVPAQLICCRARLPLDLGLCHVCHGSANFADCAQHSTCRLPACTAAHDRHAMMRASAPGSGCACMLVQGYNPQTAVLPTADNIQACGQLCRIPYNLRFHGERNCNIYWSKTVLTWYITPQLQSVTLPLPRRIAGWPLSTATNKFTVNFLTCFSQQCLDESPLLLFTVEGQQLLLERGEHLQETGASSTSMSPTWPGVEVADPNL